jgi:chromosome segregation ATPase
MSTDFLGQFVTQFNKLKQVIDDRNKNYNIFIVNLMTNVGGLALKLKDLNDSLPNYLSKFSSELRNSKNTISELQAKLSKNQSDIENNSKETNDLKNQIIALNNEKQQSLTDLNNLKTSLEQLKQQCEMEKTQFQNELSEKTRSQNEDFANQLEQRQQQFEEAKKQLEAEIQNKKQELENINNESGNVRSQLNSLLNENKQLKEENARYIQSITTATASIGELLNILQQNPRDDANFKKIQTHMNDIESYIEKISNQLQGRGPANEGIPPQQPTTSMSSRQLPENTPELNEEDFEGGKRRRKTKRMRKQKGGFVYGVFSHKKSHYSRKSSKSKKSTRKYGGRKHKHD